MVASLVAAEIAPVQIIRNVDRVDLRHQLLSPRRDAGQLAPELLLVPLARGGIGMAGEGALELFEVLSGPDRCPRGEQRVSRAQDLVQPPGMQRVHGLGALTRSHSSRHRPEDRSCRVTQHTPARGACTQPTRRVLQDCTACVTCSRKALRVRQRASGSAQGAHLRWSFCDAPCTRSDVLSADPPCTSAARLTTADLLALAMKVGRQVTRNIFEQFQAVKVWWA
jgi:hypothetical protein